MTKLSHKSQVNAYKPCSDLCLSATTQCCPVSHSVSNSASDDDDDDGESHIVKLDFHFHSFCDWLSCSPSLSRGHCLTF